MTTIVSTKCQFENFGNIDFGTVGALSSAKVKATGNIGVRCTYETPYKITINDGQNASNGVRRMKGEKSFLPYELFQQDCKTSWTNASPLSGKGTTVNTINNHPVCAKIVAPLATAPDSGTYTDTVIATITF
ncbi:spore coat protein U domain-containing protein [Phyllobacterium sp. 628]|uniref:Csu type fimbrial protein n=1 Tax=Phyllobacterium sp. 628 TaxID=2718938 RepID=UPI0016623B0E|nr:spore coat U domain-containing protein [Phyllobacterium sp. 628]QND52796.1 spore coat protein U domain-containing protein [Phyllobacterium sp. 628]